MAVESYKKCEEETSVLIGGYEFELFPREGEKIQEHVKYTMERLLSKNLIPNCEMKRLLNDKEYCYQTFGICFKFTHWTAKYTLLCKDVTKLHCEELKKYWVDKIAGYYICSQWYQSLAPNFANWLIALSEGRLNTFKTPIVNYIDDPYIEPEIDWEKKKKEEKEKHFKEFFKLKKEMEKKIIPKFIFEKSFIAVKKAETVGDNLTFVGQDNEKIILSAKNIKAEGKGFPWIGKAVELSIFKKEGSSTEYWDWEYVK